MFAVGRAVMDCVDSMKAEWVTSLFNLAFRGAKVRFKYRVKPKSEVILLNRNFGLTPKLPLSEKAQRNWSKYVLRPKFG